MINLKRGIKKKKLASSWCHKDFLGNHDSTMEKVLFASILSSVNAYLYPLGEKSLISAVDPYLPLGIKGLQLHKTLYILLKEVGWF